VRKLLICALALGGFAASAQAADLSVDSLKDPLPEKLSFAGVTVYGTIDVGYGYQEHGYPISSSFYELNYPMNSNTPPKSLSTLNNNAMSQSMVGVKVEESLGMGFVALGKMETGFNPLSGELADACKSLIQKSTNANVSSGDGSRCGQFFNGQAYGGLSNSSYGTLTVGRQNSFMTDGVGTYDPNHGSYAFSYIGYTGSSAAGIGSTETARWDNSVKYLYQFGPVHAGAMYAKGGDGSSIQDDAVGGNAGFAWKGLAVDAYYTKENGSVNAIAGVAATNSLTYNISNNEAYSIMGKYTYDLGGSFKDDAPSAKVTVFGGYVHTDMTNPDKTQDSYKNSHTIGGYLLSGVNVGESPFGTTKTLQTYWAGATYETGPWAFTGAWYRLNQNDYTGFGATVAGGNLDEISGVVDYKFNKHFDVYSGVSYIDYSGNWQKTTHDNVNVATGLRLKF